MAAKHMTKEEIREDRVVTAVVRAGEFVRENAVWVIAVAAVFVVAVSAIILISNARTRAERAAAAELLEAKSHYFANDFIAASAQFQAIIESRGSSRAAREARLFHANSELAAGNAAGAESLYREYLDSNAAKDPMSRAAGLRGLGASLTAQRRYAESAAEYRKAAAVSGNPLAADDLMQAAVVMRRAGDISGAIRALNDLLAGHPGSHLVTEARMRLQEYKHLQ